MDYLWLAVAAFLAFVIAVYVVHTFVWIIKGANISTESLILRALTVAVGLVLGTYAFNQVTLF